MAKYAAFITLDDWDHGRAFVRDTEDEAEAAAFAFLLDTTKEYRDGNDPMTDQEWLDICLSESWVYTCAIVVED